MNTLRRIIAALITTALMAALALAAALFLGLLPRQAYLVQSDSMAPAIPVGSLVIVDTNNTPQPGDVISYTTDDDVVTHRLLDINPDGTLVTKGDAMTQVDPFPATTDDIIGEVTTTIPNAAPVLAFITSPTGIISITITILAATLLLATLTSSKKNDDEHTDADNELPTHAHA